MAGKSEFVVTVWEDNGTLRCDNDWARLDFNQGPDTVRWIFKAFPAGSRAVLTFLTGPAGKYPPVPPGINVLTGGPALGVRDDQTSSFGGGVNDIVTTANLMRQGVFFYKIEVTKPDSPKLLVLDPGGTNDPSRPPTNYP